MAAEERAKCRMFKEGSEPWKAIERGVHTKAGMSLIKSLHKVWNNIGAMAIWEWGMGYL